MHVRAELERHRAAFSHTHTGENCAPLATRKCSTSDWCSPVRTIRFDPAMFLRFRPVQAALRLPAQTGEQARPVAERSLHLAVLESPARRVHESCRVRLRPRASVRRHHFNLFRSIMCCVAQTRDARKQPDRERLRQTASASSPVRQARPHLRPRSRRLGGVLVTGLSFAAVDSTCAIGRVDPLPVPTWRAPQTDPRSAARSSRPRAATRGRIARCRRGCAPLRPLRARPTLGMVAGRRLARPQPFRERSPARRCSRR